MKSKAAIELPRLRVLMVLESNFIAAGGGGTESQLRTLSRYLQKLGHSVTVLSPRFPWATPRFTHQRWNGIAVGRIAYPYWPGVGSVILWTRFVAFMLQRRDRYDAWHVHGGHHLGALTCLLGSILNKPVVVKVTGWWELERGLLAPRSGLLHAIERRWLRRATVVQAISSRIAGELQKLGFPAERILVMPNAVDTVRFSADRALRRKEHAFVGVYVGRFVPEKDVDVLLDAWAAAFAGRSDVRLWLVGDGAMEEALRQQAQRLGIGDQVEFLGPQDRVEDVLNQVDVGVLPSRIEGLSNTLLEYMACGLPSLASRVSGSEDFVRPGKNGWLFDVGDRAALAACLREAASLPAERMGELGRQARVDVEAAAALPRIAERLTALYRGARPRDLPRPNEPA